jgi:hypothetical protein
MIPARRLSLAALGLLAGAPAVADSGYELALGYRRDALNWNIAADASGTATPNVLSELDWSDIEIVELRLRADTTLPSGLHLRGGAGYGTIVDGRNRDSDYSGDDRTGEWSRSNNDSVDDDVWDLAVAAGWRFALGDGARFTPLAGYGYHRQNLRLSNGYQTIPATGAFPGLDSTYRSRWSGPWLGAELDRSAAGARGFLRLAYHWADYSAEANWNLRAEFAHPKSFEHEANGRGQSLAAGLAVPIAARGWSLALTLDYQRWRTGPGVDRVYFADGTVGTTRLNEVRWDTRSLSLGLERRF